MKTTGTVWVAAFSARTVGGPPVLTMTSGLRASTSFTSEGKRATCPSAQR